jgi:GntR family phosphonate transport system transcriptional regulator
LKKQITQLPNYPITEELLQNRPMPIHVYENNEPIYIQISEVLLNEIRTNYEPGDYLPSEQTLAGRFGVNRHTVRRAIDELVQDGVVERFRGRGTVVLDVPIDYPIQKNNRFTETLTKLGQKPVSQILKKEMIPASGGVAQRLKIEIGAQVVWMETLRFVKERPVGVSSQFLPLPYAQTVFERYESGSLHQFLFERHGVRLRRDYSLITAVLPQEEDARLLKMSRRLPLLRMKNVNVEEESAIPVEYAVARARADAMQIRVNLD